MRAGPALTRTPRLAWPRLCSQASLFGFVGASPTIHIALADEGTRKRVPVTVGGKTNELFLFMAQDDVRGTVTIEPPKGKSRLEHMGIKIELIGRIGAHAHRSTGLLCEEAM